MTIRSMSELTAASACAGVLLMTPMNAQAQKSTGVRCEALLTAKEATAIVGAGFQGPAIREPRPGFTSCEWQGSDANFGFTFANTRALQADRTTAAAMFDLDLQAVE